MRAQTVEGSRFAGRRRSLANPATGVGNGIGGINAPRRGHRRGSAAIDPTNGSITQSINLAQGQSSRLQDEIDAWTTRLATIQTALQNKFTAMETALADDDRLAWAKAEGAVIEVSNDPLAATRGADCVVTDVWVSMGDNDANRRETALRPFQVDGRLMAAAAKDTSSLRPAVEIFVTAAARTMVLVDIVPRLKAR